MAQVHRYDVGTQVRVQKRETSGHVRTPNYLMGKTGIVEKHQGLYRNPEELAYGHVDGESIPLYAIRFEQTHLWSNYEGKQQDTLVADLFEHWLEAAQ